MAIATETDRGTTVSTPPPIQNKRGRPRKQAPSEEFEQPDAKNLETAPNEEFFAISPTLVDEEFWAALENLSDDEWAKCFAYLFRTAPTIDRKSTGRPSNLRKYGSKFDREAVMREFGSGSYRLDFTQYNVNLKRNVRTHIIRFDILNMDFPPKVPPGDWVDDPANKCWEWALPAIKEHALQMNNGYPPGFDMDKLEERSEQRMRTTLELAEKLAPKPSEDKTPALIIDVLQTELKATREEMKELRNAPRTDSSMKELLDMVREENRDLRKELRELREKAFEPQPSLAEQITALKPQVAEIAQMFAGKARKQEWWEGILEKAVDQAPAVIELIKEGRAMQPNPAGVGQWAPQFTPNTPAPQPQAAQPPPAPPPSSPNVVEMPSNDPEAQLRAIAQKWLGHIMYFHQKLLEAFRTEDTGYPFRDRYLEDFGRLRWHDMRKEIGPQIFAQICIQHPQLNQVMNPPEKVFEFCKDFFTLPGEEGDDVTIVEEPAGAPA